MGSKVRHFIFGYGSLINSASRAVTGDTGRAVPVKVTGFSRHWAKISEGFGMSSVVVVPQQSITEQGRTQNSTCNGVLVEVAESEFASFDKREHGYQRMQLSLDQISFYHEEDVEFIIDHQSETKVWLYQTEKVIHPNDQFPVVFSYLDVILAGCLEYSTDFCADFLAMTQGWQHAMLNDRLTPRYPRVQKNLDTAVLNEYIAKKSLLTNSDIAQGY